MMFHSVLIYSKSTLLKILKLCFTTAQSHSWPHWPQSNGVNFFSNFFVAIWQPTLTTLPNYHLLTVISDHTDHKVIMFYFVQSIASSHCLRFLTYASQLLKVILGHIDQRAMVWTFLSISFVAILATHIDQVTLLALASCHYWPHWPVCGQCGQEWLRADVKHTSRTLINVGLQRIKQNKRQIYLWSMWSVITRSKG